MMLMMMEMPELLPFTCRGLGVVRISPHQSSASRRMVLPPYPRVARYAATAVAVRCICLCNPVAVRCIMINYICMCADAVAYVW